MSNANQPRDGQLRRFESLISDLNNVMNTSKEISQKLYEKVNCIHGFPLSREDKMSTLPLQEMPTGILVQIDVLITELKVINEKNKMILDHLDELV